MPGRELAEVMAQIAVYEVVEKVSAVREHAETLGVPVGEFCEFMERMSR